MRIVVTTYPKYQHLLENFGKFVDRFWGVGYEIDVAQEGEKVSDQLIRILKRIQDEYFILLKEDFYLYKSVDKKFLEECKEFAIGYGVDRFSLQSRGDGYEKTSELFGEAEGRSIYEFYPTEQYLCSLEASIWKTEFLKKYLKPNESDAEIEINMSKRVKNALIVVSEERVLQYTDAMRGGKERLKEEDGYLIVMEGELKGTKIKL